MSAAYFEGDVKVLVRVNSSREAVEAAIEQAKGNKSDTWEDVAKAWSPIPHRVKPNKKLPLVPKNQPS